MALRYFSGINKEFLSWGTNDNHDVWQVKLTGTSHVDLCAFGISLRETDNEGIIKKRFRLLRRSTESSGGSNGIAWSEQHEDVVSGNPSGVSALRHPNVTLGTESDLIMGFYLTNGDDYRMVFPPERRPRISANGDKHLCLHSPDAIPGGQFYQVSFWIVIEVH